MRHGHGEGSREGDALSVMKRGVDRVEKVFEGWEGRVLGETLLLELRVQEMEV